MMILRGVILFPYYDFFFFGGGGGGLSTIFFPEKEKGNGKGNENMLLDALIIPVFYFISTNC